MTFSVEEQYASISPWCPVGQNHSPLLSHLRLSKGRKNKMLLAKDSKGCLILHCNKIEKWNVNIDIDNAQISDHRREVTDAVVCKMGKVRESITDLSRSWSWNGLNRVHHTKWECPDNVLRGDERFLTSQNFIRRSSPQETMTDGLFGLYSTSL